MELITILNRCHRFQGFIYQHARFSPDRKSIEVAVRARKGSAALCSRCHQPSPGYDQLAERRFEFTLPFSLRARRFRTRVIGSPWLPWLGLSRASKKRSGPPPTYATQLVAECTNLF
jgi:hypothetical protein